MLITVVIFLLILSALVLMHEAGHFFVAKKLGIKVEEFGFGFPLTKSLFSIKRGETTYSFYPVLIGGFVKLYGEDEAGGGKIAISHKPLANSKDVHRAYFARPIWQRFIVVAAGVVMNTLLAVVIYYAFLGLSGFKTELPLIGKHTFFAVNQEKRSEVIINAVAENSPANKAKIAPFSKIVSVNGQETQGIDSFIQTIKNNSGQKAELELQNLNTGKRTKVSLMPRANPPKNEGALGVSLFPLDTVTLDYNTPAQKVFSGFTHPANLMAYNFSVMKTLIDVSVEQKTAEPISQGVSGPVGIYSVVGDIVSIPDYKERVLGILNIMGLLSISLAFFNILPVPGLDGGRLFFIMIEAVTRRKLNPKFEAYANAIGITILIGLIIIVTFKDITQLFK